MDFDLDRSPQLLARTPVVLRALLDGLDDAWIRSHCGPETFSPYDAVGHLIQSERTDWLVRARCILEHGEQRSFAPFDRFAMWQWSRGRSLDSLLDEFATLRHDNFATLRSLQLRAADLDRRGRHPALGTVTLGQLLATWVVHDLNHLGQIARTMAFQHRTAVGPWQAYLSILPQQT